MIRIILGLLLFLGHVGCGGSSDEFSLFQAPVSIRASSTNVPYDGKSTRIVYVANQLGGTIAMVDQSSEDVMDEDDGDDFDNSPIVVGGEPVSLALDDRADAPRVFAADVQNRSIVAFDAVPNDDPEIKEMKHVPVDLGGARVARVSRPIFRNRGRFSSPAMVRVEVDASVAKAEHWDVEYDGGANNYIVTGSRSGEQVARAEEGTTYTTDDGAVSFRVDAGGDRTTDDDRFRFGVELIQPMEFSGAPIDLHSNSDHLFVTTNDPPELHVVALDSLVLEQTLDLAALCPGTTSVRTGALGEGHLYIPIVDTGDICDVNVETFAANVIPVGSLAETVGVDPAGKYLYLLLEAQRNVLVWDLSNAGVEANLQINDFGLAFASFETDTHVFGLIPNVQGSVDVLDLEDNARVDADDHGDDIESKMVDERFFDEGPDSAPDLIRVNGKDGVTRSERWQLIYEGVLPETSQSDAMISGATITVIGAQFQDWGVTEGDTVIVNPDGEAEELEIINVVDQETLTLETSPSTSGEATIEIRPKGQYVVIGSISGTQRARITEGESYESDDEAIALTILASRTRPTTRGDYFTFLTIDGINPVPISGRRLPRGIATFIRPGDTVPTAYVAQTAANSISILDLNRFRERKIIQN